MGSAMLPPLLEGRGEREVGSQGGREAGVLGLKLPVTEEHVSGGKHKHVLPGHGLMRVAPVPTTNGTCLEKFYYCSFSFCAAAATGMAVFVECLC